MGPTETMRNSRYLVTISGRWYCRIRWPKEVWPTLGDGSFKRSLGTGDREEAARRLPAALQEFQNRVQAAKGRQLEANPRPLSEGEITLLVANWYAQARSAFSINPKPRQLSPEERTARRELIQRQESQLARKREQLGEADYGTLTPIVDGLLERAGLRVDRSDPSFGLLCQTLMRAWIALEETALAKMRGEFGYRPADPILDDLREVAPRSAEAAQEIRTVEDLITAYEAAKREAWSQSTANAYRPVFRLLRDVLGANRDLRSVDRQTAREVFDIVRALPRGLGKHPDLAGLPVPAAVAAAKSLGLPTLSPKSINDSYMALIVALFGWALKERWVEYNPFLSLRVAETVAPEDKRDAYTQEQLRVIFEGAPWATPATPASVRPSIYWAPLIGLFHGLRVGETCGLMTDEVIELDGVPVINLKPNDLRRLKNRESRRYLPIHPELIRLGFLDYVATRRRNGDLQLFPEAKRDANGHYGDHVTDWFARLLRDRKLKGQGVRGGALTLHSLRHTFQDALRRAELEGRIEAAVLAGRKRGNDPVAMAYGNGYEMPRLLECLRKITFDGLSLTRSDAWRDPPKAQD